MYITYYLLYHFLSFFAILALQINFVINEQVLTI